MACVRVVLACRLLSIRLLVLHWVEVVRVVTAADTPVMAAAPVAGGVLVARAESPECCVVRVDP